MSHSVSHAEQKNQKHNINLCNHERYPVHLKYLRNIQKIKYPDFQAMTYSPAKMAILSSLMLQYPTMKHTEKTTKWEVMTCKNSIPSIMKGYIETI